MKTVDTRVKDWNPLILGSKKGITPVIEKLIMREINNPHWMTIVLLSIIVILILFYFLRDPKVCDWSYSPIEAMRAHFHSPLHSSR